MKINYEFQEGEWEYEPDDGEIKEALVELLLEDVKMKHGKLFSQDGAYQMAKYVVCELDILDDLCYLYEDKLKEEFYDKAHKDYLEALEDEIAEEKELSSWYGTKSDVLGF